MAKVVTEFFGVKDGEVYPAAIMPGETIKGDLARVAIGEGWAEPDDKDEKALAATARKESEAAARAAAEKEEAEAKAEAERQAAEAAAKAVV